MKYSLWMLQDLFADSAVELKCNSSNYEIRDIRVYVPGAGRDPGTVYLQRAGKFFQNEDPRVLLSCGEDYLLLNTADLVDILNQMLSVQHYHADWEERCRNVIRQGGSLNLLLELAEEILGSALLIIDDSQYMIAYSPGLLQMADDAGIRYMLEHKSLPEQTLKEFNQNFSDTFNATRVFYIPPGIFPTASWCRQIFVDGKQAATLILTRTNPGIFPGLQHLFEQVIPFVQDWIQINRSEDSDNHLNASFARLLDGNDDSLPTASRGLSLRGWSADCPKQLIAAAAVSEQFHFDAYLAQSISLKHPEIYAIAFQKRIIFLCNLEITGADAVNRTVEELLQEYLYYGASSVVFHALTDVMKALDQATEILRCSKPLAGHLYSFRDNAVCFLTSLTARDSSLVTMHPLIAKLQHYDALHHTDFYKTLFCYLENERSQQLTSQQLFIHRNTLTLRLSKIEELWHPDLDNPLERFYLLHSFYQQLYYPDAVRAQLIH